MSDLTPLVDRMSDLTPLVDRIQLAKKPDPAWLTGAKDVVPAEAGTQVLYAATTYDASGAISDLGSRLRGNDVFAAD